MAGRLEWVPQGGAGPSSEQPWLGADAMVTETVVEQVVQALARGEAVSAVARAYGGGSVGGSVTVHSLPTIDDCGGVGWGGSVTVHSLPTIDDCGGLW